MEQFFIEADKDNSGQLSLHELAEALRQAGYKGSDEEILVNHDFLSTTSGRSITCNTCLLSLNSSARFPLVLYQQEFYVLLRIYSSTKRRRNRKPSHAVRVILDYIKAGLYVDFF